MSWLEILAQIFEVCIIPLLGVLTTFLIKWLQIKSSELQIKMDNDVADKYMAMLTNTITECVLATNQTYVEALKKDNVKYFKNSWRIRNSNIFLPPIIEI